MVGGHRYTTVSMDSTTTSASTWASWSTTSSATADSTTWNNWNTIEWEAQQEGYRSMDGTVWVRWTMQPVGTNSVSDAQMEAQRLQAQRMASTDYHVEVWGSWQEIEDFEAGYQERRAQREAEQQAKQREKALAKKRAEALLKSVLNEEELEEYEAHSTITVKVDAVKKLRFKVGRVKNVEELDADGNVKAELCVHVQDQVPDEDNVLAQLLFAKTDLEGFYAMANRYER